MTQIADFMDILQRSLDQNTLVKLVMTKYRGSETALIKISIRLVVIKANKYLNFVRHYTEKDVTENLPVSTGVETIAGFLGDAFTSAHLLMTTGDVHIEFNSKGKCRLTCSKPTQKINPSSEHDREKQRIIDRRRPFLNALGITSSSGQVLPSMSHKWKQINKFIEFFDHAIVSSKISGKSQIDVVDFGCGKGYLTFAVHDFLCNTRGKTASVMGVELKGNLVRFCNDTAEKLTCTGLRFCQGDVESYVPEKTDALIALHACDTATDVAINMGIRAGASIIMCAPCCHKQIRPQMKSPEVLKSILRFGSHLAQEAEMVTDGLRALLLETQGYDVGVFEFISLEHTDKNKMILGIKCSNRVNPDPIWAQINAIKDFYGIREHKLETLLKSVSS
ncbi:MAG: SAM-dependent methyltransferase [Kiritimatiellae bacterium]|nr:SAM-dependent methyltransferase [Kiritimatiellia bacterium]MDD5521114.1 SAM-dependent methyltransferase [Kiritimatiellia bacterium]